MSSNCIFCKIAKHEIPSYTIYEDEKVIAFLDISQATPGHTLVVPKKHAADITVSDDKDLQDAILIAKKIAAKMLKSLDGCIGVNLLINCKEGAGQTILHTHIHVIPRYDEDDIEIKLPNNMNLNGENDLTAMAKLLKVK